MGTVYRMGDEVLIAACSDGAGSATHSQQGAERACLEAFRYFSSLLCEDREDQPISLTQDAVRDCCVAVASVIQSRANEICVPRRELACTLLVAILSNNFTAFLQIGDGAIVIPKENSYTTVFWPQSGEYVNTTCFVTDPKAREICECSIIDQPTDEVALLTDGLQLVALELQNRTAHSDFFRPLFTTLRDVDPDEVEDLQVPFTQFLDSERINARTDDDKTLILAVRSRQ